MSLTDTQKELLNKLIKMPRGTVLRKGKQERILWGLDARHDYVQNKDY